MFVLPNSLFFNYVLIKSVLGVFFFESDSMLFHIKLSFFATDLLLFVANLSGSQRPKYIYLVDEFGHFNSQKLPELLNVVSPHVNISINILLYSILT